jgi:hypothetical protein
MYEYEIFSQYLVSTVFCCKIAVLVCLLTDRRVPPGDKRSLALFFVVVALVLTFVTFPPVFLPFGVDVPFCGVF